MLLLTHSYNHALDSTPSFLSKLRFGSLGPLLAMKPPKFITSCCLSKSAYMHDQTMQFIYIGNRNDIISPRNSHCCHICGGTETRPRSPDWKWCPRRVEFSLGRAVWGKPSSRTWVIGGSPKNEMRNSHPHTYTLSLFFPYVQNTKS